MSGLPTTSPVVRGGTVYLTLVTRQVENADAAGRVEGGEGVRPDKEDEASGAQAPTGGAGASAEVVGGIVDIGSDDGFLYAIGGS